MYNTIIPPGRLHFWQHHDWLHGGASGRATDGGGEGSNITDRYTLNYASREEIYRIIDQKEVATFSFGIEDLRGGHL